MTESQKVRVLHYPRKEKKVAVKTIDRKLDRDNLLEGLERIGLRKEEIKCRVFCGGKVVMYYNESESYAPNVSINGTVYHGDVVFVGMNSAGAADLSANQIKAIKAVVKGVSHGQKERNYQKAGTGA